MDALRARRFAVIDVETTGFSPVADRVVEFACVIVQDRRIEYTWSTLVNPLRPIPRYATAVHGITDEHVANARHVVRRTANPPALRWSGHRRAQCVL